MTLSPASFDRQAFPRLSDYLDFLPGGLESHPESLVKRAVFRHFASARPLTAAQLEQLPEGLRASLADTKSAESWVRETHFMGSLMAIADAHHLAETEFEQWLMAVNRELIGGRVYRVLMSVSSPELLMPLARFKWNTLRKGGTSFDVETEKKSCIAVLRFPARLFDQKCLKVFVPAFAAVLEVSNAKHPRVKLERFDETSATYAGHWE